MIKELTSLDIYGIPWRGNKLFHKELAFFATENDLVLGVVALDRVDKDYSWVLIAHKSIVTPQFGNQVSDSGYSLVNFRVSRQTQATATRELHTAMERLGKP